MLDNIKIGSQVNVKVVKSPTNAAAAKTLERLLAKSPEHQAHIKRGRQIRKNTTLIRTRSGRDWAVRIPKQHPVTGELGEQGTILASYDVLKDLKSVQQFVEVAPA